MRVYGRRERLIEMQKYCEGIQNCDIMKKLQMLDPENHTEKEFADVIGQFWYKTRVIKCEECGKSCPHVIEFGDGECDDCGRTVRVCVDCIKSIMKEFGDLPSSVEFY